MSDLEWEVIKYVLPNKRFFGCLKASFRRIATGYEKTSRSFMAMIKLAAIRLWCQFYESAAKILTSRRSRSGASA